MRITILLSLMLVLICSCNKKEKNNAKADFWENYPSFYDKEIKLDKYFNETKKYDLNDSNIYKLYKIAHEYSALDNFDKQYKVLKFLQLKLSKKEDTINIAKINRILGDYFEFSDYPDSAFYYYNKSAYFYNRLPSEKVEMARVSLYKANVLYDIGIVSESELELTRALSLLSENSDLRLQYEASVLMTLILKELRDFEEAEKYYSKIPILLTKLRKEGEEVNKLERSWLSYYNNLGGFYDKRKDFNKAQEVYKHALGNSKVELFPKLHAMLLNNYAHSLTNFGFLNNKNIIDSLLAKSLVIRQNIQHEQGIVASHVRIAEFLLKKGDSLKAINHMEKANKLAIQIKSNSDILRSLEFLSLNVPSKKNYFMNRYLLVKDSLQGIERATRNKFARIAYETEEVEAENTILLKRTFYYGAAALLFFLLGVFSYFLYRLRLRNKKLEYQRAEQTNVQKIHQLLYEQDIISEKTRTEERDRISKDLHDAVINRVFTTRLNLTNLNTEDNTIKAKLINELIQTENQIREISHDLHTNLFSQKQNYASVLENLVTKQQNSFNTQFTCKIDSFINWNDVDINIKTQLYLILQELLQNVNKHAQAKNCYVFILKLENTLTLRVHDNGVGFKNGLHDTGLGLKSIKSRLVKLNANFNLKEHHEMTTVEITIPIVFC